MLQPTENIAGARPDERLKQRAALLRALPVTRLVDYGVPLGDALALHGAATGTFDESSPDEHSADPHEPDWDVACEQRAGHHAALAAEAEALGHRLTAAQAWRAAFALLQGGQLAFHEDTPRKAALYERAHHALLQHARLSGDLDAFTRPTALGALHGWVLRPVDAPARAAVVIVGGLSGWAGVYLDMARALAARGVLVVLAEGPGQGLTRLRGGMHLTPATQPLFRAFLDHARDHLPQEGPARLGIWGNSFGGLLAAGVAVADTRVSALCVNGAPMALSAVPGQRTAREQMQALFGTRDEAALLQRLALVSLDARQHRFSGAIAVAEGGRDPLAPLGAQAGFLALASPGRGRVFSWADGEHTLYNHAAERNALLADWFVQALDDNNRRHA